MDIHESGEHLLRLINDILDLSKMEAGRMEVHLERVDVTRVIQESAAMVRPQAAKKDLSVGVQCEDDVAHASLDPGMLRQILVNLLSNAVKFTPEGGQVQVRAAMAGRDIRVQVEDTGIGIAAGDVRKIFEEFYQVDGSYSRNFGGTGLGLALVRRMVEMQGGRIDVQSTPGEGSCFTCLFPDCALDPEPVAEIGGKAEATGSVDIQAKERSILLVEDNAVNRKLARNVLRSRGYRVVEATSGEEALRVLARQSPDLVLMDIQLPGMDGLEATRRLKSDPHTAALPVVALTANVREDDREAALAAGCAGFIAKPIRLAQFPDEVRTYLEAGSAVS
jgi:CheY-like chemotaxis protein